MAILQQGRRREWSRRRAAPPRYKGAAVPDRGLVLVGWRGGLEPEKVSRDADERGSTDGGGKIRRAGKIPLWGTVFSETGGGGDLRMEAPELGVILCRVWPDAAARVRLNLALAGRRRPRTRARPRGWLFNQLRYAASAAVESSRLLLAMAWTAEAPRARALRVAPPRVAARAPTGGPPAAAPEISLGGTQCVLAHLRDPTSRLPLPPLCKPYAKRAGGNYRAVEAVSTAGPGLALPLSTAR